MELPQSSFALARDVVVGAGGTGNGDVVLGTYNGRAYSVQRLPAAVVADAAVRAALAEEIAALARLQHRNVLATAAYFALDARAPYIAAEAAERGTLRQFLSSAAEISWEARVQFASDIASGMHYLHSRVPAVLHRDLKCDNVLLDRSLCAKVGGLGPATLEKLRTAARVTTAPQPILWCAPELLGDEQASFAPACDVYSYAMTLYEIASRKLPWDGRTPAQVLSAVLQERRPKLPEDCDPRLEALIKRCWAQQPSERILFPDIVLLLPSTTPTLASDANGRSESGGAAAQAAAAPPPALTGTSAAGPNPSTPLTGPSAAGPNPSPPLTGPSATGPNPASAPPPARAGPSAAGPSPSTPRSGPSAAGPTTAAPTKASIAPRATEPVAQPAMGRAAAGPARAAASQAPTRASTSSWACCGGSRQEERERAVLLTEQKRQLDMAAARSSGKVLTADELRASLVVPQTDFVGPDGVTPLNTVTDAAALPAFLRMNTAKDILPEGRLTAGGAGTIVRAKLLRPDAVQRNAGIAICAVKEVADWPMLSREESLERFRREVAIMWSVSFHPNVIKMVGYTEIPSTIVTRLYPTDLFRYLHSQDDTSPLEPYLLLNICSGLVAAVAAVHAMGIAHRDIKSPNYLMQEPRPGSPFPDPILCDFGLSRAASGTQKFNGIRGLSPSYAPPEIFARVHMRNAQTSIEDDQSSDVYSMGVVLWETAARRIPWDGVADKDIEASVRAGGRVPELEVGADDRVRALVSKIISTTVVPSPERRPTMNSVNRKFAALIRELLG